MVKFDPGTGRRWKAGPSEKCSSCDEPIPKGSYAYQPRYDVYEIMNDVLIVLCVKCWGNKRH